MGESVNTLRHIKVFDAEEFSGKRVDVIGAGATGSRIALALAKLGITNIHVWDFDKIESHNIANQAYGLKDIGKPKVRALEELIYDQTGIRIEPHEEAATKDSDLGSYVFLLTDTMASRKEIWNGALKYKAHIDLVVETRMGISEGRVYSVVPSEPSEVKFYENTFCDDDEAEESMCGARTVVGSTAELVSGYAVWAFLRFYKHQIERDVDRPEVEMLFFANPAMTMTSSPKPVLV